jgi:hypothetical protein
VWEKIWQRCKGWRVRRLATDPHSVFLLGRPSGTCLKLEFKPTIDAPLFIETQIVHHAVRLIGLVSFQTSERTWTAPEQGLIDTGSPISVIPQSIWQNAAHSFLAREIGTDIAGVSVAGRLGLVTLRFEDDQHISPPLRVKANLIYEDNLPLILGFADVLTEVTLVSDFQVDLAYLLFRP